MKKLILLSLLVVITIIAAGCESGGTAYTGTCGDGVVQTPNEAGVNEQCESIGGMQPISGSCTVDGHAGTKDCIISTCLYGACIVSPYCGDGAVNLAVEECDDGNTLSTDSCNANCQRIELLELYYGSPYHVSVVGNTAYITDRNDGLVVLDVSNPRNPTLKGSYDLPFDGRGISVVGNYAYIVYNTGLVVFDVSNPANPTVRGGYDTGENTEDVSVVGNYAYIADYTNGLVIVDVSNPANPTARGAYDTAGFAEDVSVVGNYAYVAVNTRDTVNTHGLSVVDVSNPENPRLEGNYDVGENTIVGVSVVSNYAYLADWDTGLYVLNVTNI